MDLRRTTELLGTAVELTPVTSDKGCMNTCVEPEFVAARMCEEMKKRAITHSV